MKAFGDSITVGVGASPASNSYINLLGSALGTTITNAAVSGSQAGDQSCIVYNTAAGDRFIVAVGGNDQKQYKNDAVKQGYYRGAVANLLTWLLCPDKKTGTSGQINFTGSWVNTPSLNTGKKTTALGDKASTTVSGSTIYVGTLVQNSSSVKGTANIKVDGVLRGSINCDGAGCTTINGKTFFPVVTRIDGLCPGPHLVEVEVTSTGTIFYLEYIAGNDQASSPAVFVGNVLRLGASVLGSNSITDSTTDAYNAILADLVSQYQADGFNVHLVDTHAVVDPATDLTDGTHPNNTGHAKMKQAHFNVINCQPQTVNYPMTNGHTLSLTLVNGLVSAFEEIENAG